MKLSCLLSVIDFPHFKGIFKVGIKKHYHNLVLYCQLHQLQFPNNEPEMINQIMTSLTEKISNDPFSENILSSLSTQIRKEHDFSYSELEILDDNLNKIDINNIKDYLIFKFQTFNVALYPNQIKRIKRFINSFLLNYNIINDTIRFYINSLNSENNIEVNKPINNKKLTEIVEEKNKEKVSAEISEKIEEKSLISKIFDFSQLPHISSHLCNQIFNYYRFYDDVELEEKKDSETNVIYNIKIPCLFNIVETTDISFYESYFNSLKSISTETTTLMIKSIYNFFIENIKSFSSLEFKSLSYLLFINMIRYMFDTHLTWYEQNLSRILLTPSIQTNVFNTYLKQLIPDCKLIFSVFPPDFLFFNDKKINNEIQNISNEFKHLISISQEEFANLVFKKINDTTSELESEKNNFPDDFILNKKKIINIDDFLKQSNINEDSTGLIINQNKYTFNYSLLDYNKSKKSRIISDCYYNLLEYIRDPATILLLDNKKIPKMVLKLYESLKFILNDSYFNKDNISTLNYFKILCNKLPNAKNIGFNILLYIIYQIIIPYQYDVNRITYFEDYFL